MLSKAHAQKLKGNPVTVVTLSPGTPKAALTYDSTTGQFVTDGCGEYSQVSYSVSMNEEVTRVNFERSGAKPGNDSEVKYVYLNTWRLQKVCY